MRKREPYVGDRRRLVLAFDLGTTYSGISYSILDPGNVPEIHGVNRSALSLRLMLLCSDSVRELLDTPRRNPLEVIARYLP